STNFKIISYVGEGSFMLSRIINNSPEKAGVLSFCDWSSKSYSLIFHNIVTIIFKIIFSLNNYILKTLSFPYHKVRTNKINSKKPCKVKVPSVKDIISIRLIWDLIHYIHVVNLGFSNVNKCRYLCY